MNRGIWLLTKEIPECYRDIDELLIIGGVLWAITESMFSSLNLMGLKHQIFFGKSLSVTTALLHG